jgi:hypothetical protein
LLLVGIEPTLSVVAAPLCSDGVDVMSAAVDVVAKEVGVTEVLYGEGGSGESVNEYECDGR